MSLPLRTDIWKQTYYFRKKKYPQQFYQKQYHCNELYESFKRKEDPDSRKYFPFNF